MDEKYRGPSIINNEVRVIALKRYTKAAYGVSLSCKQFPIVLASSFTIDSSQGKSLKDKV